MEKKIAEVAAALEEYATAYKGTLGEDQTKISAVDGALNIQKEVLSGSGGIADANARLAAAKSELRKAVDGSEKGIDALVTEVLGEIDKYRAEEITAIKTAYNGTYAALIGEAKSAGLELVDIEDTQENRNLVTKTLTGIKAEVDRYLANYSAHVEADEYKEEQEKNVKNEDARLEYADIDFTELFKEATDATRAAATANAKKLVDGFVASLATYLIKVTVGEEACRVTYGTKLTLSDLHVSGFNVSAATLNGKPVPAEASDDEDLIIYNPVTVAVTGKTAIEGFKPKEEWTAAADASDVANIINNNLVSVTSDGGEGYSTGTVSIGGKSFTRWWTGLEIAPKDKNTGAVNEVHDNKATPIVIIAKACLQSLTVYLTLADKSGMGTNGHGTIYAVINDGTPIVIKTLTSEGDMKVAWTPDFSIKAGDIIKIYAVNENENGARLHLFGVDAIADTGKIEKTVNVTWGTVTESYHYFEAITAPDPTGLEDNEKFGYWYRMDGSSEVKWTDGTVLTEGNHTYLAKITTVTVNVAESWSIDFAATKPGTNVNLNDGDVLVEGALTVKTSSNSNRNAGGYLKGNTNGVLELVVLETGDFTYVCANSNNKRSLVIKDADGNEVHSQTMDGKAHTGSLAAGTYTVTFLGGECRIESMGMTYGS